MSCLPGLRDSLNIITTEDKSAVVAWCCFKRLSASPLKKRILFRKRLFTLIHLIISVMIVHYPFIIHQNIPRHHFLNLDARCLGVYINKFVKFL